MFLDWKNQYCQNDCTTQDNLQFQCNPLQITHGIFFPTELEQKKDLKMCMETQRTPIAKATLRKENRAGEIMLSDFRLYILSFSHQNSMVLAQKQKYKSME